MDAEGIYNNGSPKHPLVYARGFRSRRRLDCPPPKGGEAINHAPYRYRQALRMRASSSLSFIDIDVFGRPDVDVPVLKSYITPEAVFYLGNLVFSILEDRCSIFKRRVTNILVPNRRVIFVVPDRTQDHSSLKAIPQHVAVDVFVDI